MKDTKIYTKRLLKFAKHLKKITEHAAHGLLKETEVIALTSKVRIHYNVKYQEWVFDELPIVFNEWHFTEKYGHPMCEGMNESEGTVAAVIDFFNIDQDEFCHLFDVEGLQSPPRFGGSILSLESSGPAFASNIYELVKIKNDAQKN
jgi:hypothetical protein